MEGYLTEKEAAEYLKISTRRLYDLRVRGLKHAKMSDGPKARIRYQRKWLDEWMEQQAAGG